MPISPAHPAVQPHSTHPSAEDIAKAAAAQACAPQRQLNKAQLDSILQRYDMQGQLNWLHARSHDHASETGNGLTTHFRIAFQWAFPFISFTGVDSLETSVQKHKDQLLQGFNERCIARHMNGR